MRLYGEHCIPFRADTGFERADSNLMNQKATLFQSLSGLSLGLNVVQPICAQEDTLLFQSLSGLSLGLNGGKDKGKNESDEGFQSLSGLSLGLNRAVGVKPPERVKKSFNPFQG